MTLHDADDADREADCRAYLLGALPPERQEQIEERLFTDADLHAELQATGDDLIHAYLAGELSAADRERFETHFLASPRRRERFAFLRTLVTATDRVRTAERPAAGPAAVSSRWTALLPWAAALLVATGALGWSIVEKRQSTREVAAAHQREDSLRQQLAAQTARVRELEGRVRATGALAGIATWVLHTSVERGTGTVDGFTVQGDWIRLRAPLEHDLRVTSYRASLQTSEGGQVLRVGGLRETAGPEGRTLDVIVPAALLRPGSYLLSLQRDAAGAPEELSATTFVVR